MNGTGGTGGAPFRLGMEQAVAAGGQAAREQLQALQRLAQQVGAVGIAGLHQQGQQPRAQVVVQVLRQVPALFAAREFGGPAGTSSAVKTSPGRRRRRMPRGVRPGPACWPARPSRRGWRR